MSHSKYRLWCETESAYVTVWAEAEPTLCPNNSGHTIDGDKTTILQVCDHALVKLDSPELQDGKPLFTPDLFPAGTLAVFTGRPDDIPNGVRWAGDAFEVTASSEGDTAREFQFMDLLYLVGGTMSREGGKLGDNAKYQIYGPATAGTENIGSGNFDKVEIGPGMNMYIPAAGDGDWDLNLTEKLNANVDFTKAVPVPNLTGTGWFDYDPPTDSLTVNSEQTGAYDLYDFDVYFAPHLPLLPLLGSGQRDLTPYGASPKALLPHWKHKVTIHHGAGTHQLDVAWTLLLGRYPF